MSGRKLSAWMDSNGSWQVRQELLAGFTRGFPAPVCSLAQGTTAVSAPKVRILLAPDRYTESGEFTVWTAQMDVDGVPHTDGTGATPLLAMSQLAEGLARQLAELESSLKEPGRTQ